MQSQDFRSWALWPPGTSSLRKALKNTCFSINIMQWYMRECSISLSVYGKLKSFPKTECWEPEILQSWDFWPLEHRIVFQGQFSDLHLMRSFLCTFWGISYLCLNYRYIRAHRVKNILYIKTELWIILKELFHSSSMIQLLHVYISYTD